MKYDNKLVTKDGITLMTDSITNKENPIIDKMLVLNTDVPEGKTPDSLNLNDFSKALSFDVNNVSQTANSFTASAVISNSGININYTAQLIGLSGYLNESSNNRKLFAVAQATEPFVIEKQADTPITLVPSITIGFSNSENVQLTVKNDVYVTHNEIETLKADIAQNISGPDSTVSKNIAQAKTDANNYTDSVKDGLQKNIDTTNQRVDTVHDQLGGDIASAKSELNGQIGELSDKSLKFIKSVDGSDNYDDLTDSGFYRIQATPPKNGPSSIWSILVVYRRDDLAYQQVLDQYGGSYSRMLNPGGWKNEWERFVSQNDTDKLSDKINDLSNKTLKFNSQIDGSNIDNIKETGIYTGSYTSINGIGQVTAFQLRVFNDDLQNILRQEITVTYNNKGRQNLNFSRNWNGGVGWQSWQTVATTDDTAALSTRLDKAQDQLGADIRDAEQRAKDDANKKIQFFNNETDAHNANLPAGTLKIVRG